MRNILKGIATLPIFIILVLSCSHRVSDPEYFRLIRNGKPSEVLNAIKNGANLEARDDFGLTPLMVDCQSISDSEVLKEFLYAGSDVNARNTYGVTPLMCAAQSTKNPEIITLLLNSGAVALAEADDGKTASDYIVENGSLDAKVIDKFKISLGSFIHLAKVGTIEEVQTAIDNGADLKSRDKNNMTPLMAAAKYNNYDILPICHRWGKIPIKDNTGQSLHVDDYLGKSSISARMAVSEYYARIANRLKASSTQLDIDTWTELLNV